MYMVERTAPPPMLAVPHMRACLGDGRGAGREGAQDLKVGGWAVEKGGGGSINPPRTWPEALEGALEGSGGGCFMILVRYVFFEIRGSSGGGPSSSESRMFCVKACANEQWVLHVCAPTGGTLVQHVYRGSMLRMCIQGAGSACA